MLHFGLSVIKLHLFNIKKAELHLFIV